MAATPSARPGLLAWISLILGVVTLPALAATGPIVLLLGWLGLRRVNASDGRLSGRSAAIAAVVLGGVGTVVGAISLLALVILPFREAGNRAQCAYNLGRIGLATNKFYDASGKRLDELHYPRGAVPHAGLPPDQRLSWMVELLPFLGQASAGPKWETLSARVRAAKPWGEADDPEIQTTVVSFYLCPSHPEYDPRVKIGRTNYPGIAGLDPDAPRLPLEDPRAGMFGYDRLVRFKDVTAGTSCTFLAVETTIDNGPWLTAGIATVRGVDPSVETYIGKGLPFGGCHPHGANTLHVDASVEWLTETVQPTIFRRHATLSGYAPGDSEP